MHKIAVLLVSVTTMRKMIVLSAVSAVLSFLSWNAGAQYVPDAEEPQESQDTVVITLEDALRIALSENVAVKVADKEIERVGWAKKGTYASLFPQINATGSYQRTLKKQVMYMDFDMSSIGGAAGGSGAGEGEAGNEGRASSSGGGGGIEVGRWNTYSAGVSASMPIVNAQLWESIKLSGQQVELAVEQARESRLNTVTSVKQAFYAVLLAKEAFNVYKDAYENAVANFTQTQKKYAVDKASKLEYTRAKATVANAIPDVYNAESSVILALWQLKAVMGVNLDTAIDVAGSLADYAESMLRDISENEDADLSGNTSLRQLAIQAEQLATTVRMQKAANLPSLALSFNYSYNAMTNDFNFSEYRWTPYSYLGISLNIPIFAGGSRRATVKQSKIQADELELQRINTERQLKISIRSNLQTMETGMKSYIAAQDAVKTAQKGYDIAVKSYNVGRSTITELNDAQLALTQARLSESQAIYNFVTAKSSLEQTLGFDFSEYDTTNR